MVVERKKTFVRKTVLSNTLSSAFQRANVYVPNVSHKDKLLFSSFFQNELVKLGNQYESCVSERKHIENIENFALTISSKFPYLLQGNKLRFGVAQKAVNLYVKFLWTLGDINHEPPHCPVDGIVIKAVGATDKWTRLDCKVRYGELISLIKSKAKESKKSIALWELELWNGQ